MDVGKFKASRGRLTAWVGIPPLLIFSIGISSYALKQQSEWQLERTRLLAETLPKVVETRQFASELMAQFQDSEKGVIASEDQLISYLQSTARNMSFTVDSLKVDRKISAAQNNLPILMASVKGSGSVAAIKAFIGEVTARHQLLTESSLQIQEGSRNLGVDVCSATLSFELVLFDPKDGGK